MKRFKILVVGSEGFIGSYLMPEIEADCLDLECGEDVRGGIKDHYDIIIFLACNQANTQEAYEENRQMYEALDRYRRENSPYLIYISSAAIYNLNSWYALSKQLGEAYATRFQEHTVLRLSNVFGHGDGHGAPDRFMRGEKVINGDGTQIRDLIPVEKVVTRIMNCLEIRQIGTFNVSSGVGTTVNEMFKLFGRGKPKYVKQDYGVERSVLTPGRIE